MGTTIRSPDFLATRWATSQTHFYILVTSLIEIVKRGAQIPDDLVSILIKFDSELKKGAANIDQALGRYLAFSAKQTTDVSRRVERAQLFTKGLDIIRGLNG